MAIPESTPFPAPGAAGQGSVALEQRVKGIVLRTEFILLLVVVGLLLFGYTQNTNLLSPNNVKIMSRDIAILGIAAIGVGFPIITAGIDLSVGSIVGFGGVVVAWFMMREGYPIWVSVLLTLVAGVLIGVMHGLFVTKLNMHGFLITLVTMGLARGFILKLTDAFPITGLPRDFTTIGQKFIWDAIPIPVLICAAIALFAYFLLRYTYIGRQIYAVGGNIEAARYSGIPVARRVILAYVISVVCAIIVGMLQAARLSLGHPGTGEGFEMLAIASCILGGYSLMGGEGNILGALIGAALIGVLQTEMVVLKINPYWHKIVIYLVLAAAITIDYSRRGGMLRNFRSRRIVRALTR